MFFTMSLMKTFIFIRYVPRSMGFGRGSSSRGCTSSVGKRKSILNCGILSIGLLFISIKIGGSGKLNRQTCSLSNPCTIQRGLKVIWARYAPSNVITFSWQFLLRRFTTCGDFAIKGFSDEGSLSTCDWFSGVLKVWRIAHFPNVVSQDRFGTKFSIGLER